MKTTNIFLFSITLIYLGCSHQNEPTESKNVINNQQYSNINRCLKFNSALLTNIAWLKENGYQFIEKSKILTYKKYQLLELSSCGPCHTEIYVIQDKQVIGKINNYYVEDTQFFVANNNPYVLFQCDASSGTEKIYTFSIFRLNDQKDYGDYYQLLFNSEGFSTKKCIYSNSIALNQSTLEYAASFIKYTNDKRKIYKIYTGKISILDLIKDKVPRGFLKISESYFEYPEL